MKVRMKFAKKKVRQHPRGQACLCLQGQPHSLSLLRTLELTTLRLYILTCFRTPWKPELLVRSSEI